MTESKPNTGVLFDVGDCEEGRWSVREKCGERMQWLRDEETKMMAVERDEVRVRLRCSGITAMRSQNAVAGGSCKALEPFFEKGAESMRGGRRSSWRACCRRVARGRAPFCMQLPIWIQVRRANRANCRKAREGEGERVCVSVPFQQLALCVGASRL